MTLGLVRRYLRYAKPYAWMAPVILFLGFTRFLGPLSFPQALRMVIDVIVPETPKGTPGTLDFVLAGGVFTPPVDTSDRVVLLLRVLMVQGGIFVIGSLASWTRDALGARFRQLVLTDIRRHFYGHLLRQPKAFFDEGHPAKLLDRLIGDVSMTQGVLNLLVSQIWIELGMLIVAAWILFAYNWKLTLISLGTLPLAVLLDRFGHPRLREIQERQNRIMLGMTSRVSEALSGIRVVKSLAGEKRECTKFSELSWEYFREVMCRARSEGYFNIGRNFLGTLKPLLILCFGAWFCLRGETTVGELSVFILYVGYLDGPLGTLLGVYGTLEQVKPALARIIEILDLPAEPDGTVAHPLLGRLQFENVSFSYARDQHALQNVSFTINRGECVGIVGPSGAGKSTLAAVLVGFYRPTEGTVRIDGRDLCDYDLRALRKQLVLVPQETMLFSGTVRENIAYGRPEASEAEICEAARITGIDALLRGLPDGYDTDLGVLGGKLSGGERQRIALARAILVNPRVLILDEATNQLDPCLENEIYANLAAWGVGRTILIVAHRIYRVAECDRILVMDGGRLVEEGRHADLMRTGGLYCALLKEQLRRFPMAERNGVGYWDADSLSHKLS